MHYKVKNSSKLLEQISELTKINNELNFEISQNREIIKNLITKISHEFKTPLSSIIGFTDLLKKEISDTHFLDYLDTISFSSKHLLSLITDILDITRSQYKPLQLEYSLFNTKECIKDILKCFDTKNIKYTLINIYITADYTRFRQLVFNLISNAVKFNTGNLPITIITYCEKDFFCFEIKDNGIGIKKENYTKIFEFFTQLSDNNINNKTGSGIGLSLCKTISEAHQGTISVTSEENKGSTFIFKIPITLNQYTTRV